MVIGLFGLFEAVMLIGFHYQNDRNRATIIFGATVIAGGFALYTFLQGIEERRSRSAQQLIQRWNSPEMLPLRLVLREITENRLDVDTLKRPAKGEISEEMDHKRAHLVTVLNFYEEMAIAALRKIANEDRLYEFFDAIIRQSATKLRGWIEHEQAFDNEQEYYCEFLTLAERWRERKH
jgi:hypothetical protein